MNPKFLKPYSPQGTEDDIYKRWVESGFFNPDTCILEGITEKSAVPYSIVLPPPNVTGMLTMGHVLNNTIQDVLIRKARMEGWRRIPSSSGQRLDV